jgi:hypothetical protein
MGINIITISAKAAGMMAARRPSWPKCGELDAPRRVAWPVGLAG